MTEISQEMQDMGARARAAASILASVPSQSKTQALMAAADALDATRADVLAANALDMEAGREKGLSAAMLDRLLLDNARIDGICGALRAIAAQDDPVGAIMAEWDRPTGLHIQRVRTPLGVIGVIYESRPNVTAAGNAVILRGGSESANSSRAIHAALLAGLRAADLPEDAIQLVQTTDRAAVSAMLRMVEHIDVIVPRGGKGLVGLVQREARVPVFAHLEGICHVYVDVAADPAKARAVVLNAKTRRTGNGLGADILADLAAAGVELRVGEGLQHLPGTIPAKPDDFGREFLDMILAVALVDDVAGAIAHIRRYGSQHTEAIITEDDSAAAEFFARLDSAILMRNASTQFADGGGPVGAEQLTSFKYLVTGDGTVRA